MDRTVPLAAARMLDFVRATEVGTDGSSGYNVIFGFNQDNLPVPVTRMTIDEVLGAQASWTKRFGSSATGGYQFMRATLTDLKRELGLRGSQILDENLQDRLGYHLLKRRGYDQYMAGQISRTEFGKRLAQEWASFPVLAAVKGAHRQLTRGQSFYAGDGLNKALIKPEVFEAVLDDMKELGDAMPAPVVVPDPRPEPIIEEPSIPAPIGHNGGPSLDPLHTSLPTPVEQVSKVVGGVKWGAIATALWTAVVAADVLPAAFQTPEFATAMTGVITLIAGAIGTYLAPKNAEPGT